MTLSAESSEQAWAYERWSIDAFARSMNWKAKWLPGEDRELELRFTHRFPLQPAVLGQEVYASCRNENRVWAASLPVKQRQNAQVDSACRAFVLRVSIPSESYPPPYSKDAPAKLPSLDWADVSAPGPLRDVAARVFEDACASRLSGLRDGTIRRPPAPSSKVQHAGPTYVEGYILDLVAQGLNALDGHWDQLGQYEVRLKAKGREADLVKPNGCGLLASLPGSHIDSPQQQGHGSPAVAPKADPTVSVPAEQESAEPSEAPATPTSPSPSSPAPATAAPAAAAPTAAASAAGQHRLRSDGAAWTADEQARLELALRQHPPRPDQDANTRWTLISGLVKSRSAKQCAARFQEIRQAILLKREEDAKAKDMEVEKEARRKARVEAAEAALAALSTGKQDVKLEGLQLEDTVGTVTLLGVTLVAACGRCGHSGELKVALPTEPNPEKPVAEAQSCPKCKTEMRAVVGQSLGHAASNVVGFVDMAGGHIQDLVYPDFSLSCVECSQRVVFRGVLPATPRNTNCRGCHKRLGFRFDSVACGHASTGLTRTENLMKAAAAKEAIRPKAKAVDVIALKAGTPLPNSGACEHYKKSFRWLRFPCCGRAFPCDVCHDSQTDHKCEWANKMICGHCSREQPFSQKACTHCGDSLKSASTVHWEGGKGCRNPFAMSSKDSHKGKLIKKLISEDQKAKKEEKEKKEAAQKKAAAKKEASAAAANPTK